MVLDGIAVASTVISLMVNGLCCLWQQQEEQKLREAIRHDVRTEYWHHRRSMDLQMPLNPDASDRSPLDANDIKLIQDERRKKLMIAKMKVAQHRDMISESDLHVFGSLLSPVNSLHNAEDVFHDIATNNSPNNILDCMTVFRNQTTSLFDDCDTEDDDLNDFHSPSFVDICLD
jgi:hypothetical protein